MKRGPGGEHDMENGKNIKNYNNIRRTGENKIIIVLQGKFINCCDIC